MAGWIYDKERDVLISRRARNLSTSTQRTNRGHIYRDYRLLEQKVKSINNDAAQINRMREKVAFLEGKAIYRRRKTIVEPVFGHIKGPFGLRRLLLRGYRPPKSSICSPALPTIWAKW